MHNSMYLSPSLKKSGQEMSSKSSTPGISFSKAWNNRETMTYQDQDFYVLSKDDLITAKRAAGRDVDLEDVRLLELDQDMDDSER